MICSRCAFLVLCKRDSKIYIKKRDIIHKLIYKVQLMKCRESSIFRFAASLRYQRVQYVIADARDSSRIRRREAEGGSPLV